MSQLPKPIQDVYIKLASSPLWDNLVIGGLLVAELFLGIIIITKVPYTEIDWEAYMQEVSMWWDDGQYDYRQIYGGTGPLVYPAGFLYLFLALRWITNNGNNIRFAQYLFLGMYLLLQTLVLLVYTRAARFLSETMTTSNRQQQKTTTPATTSTNNTTNNTTTTNNNNNNSLSLPQAHTIWSWRIAMGLCCCSKRLHSIFMLRLFNEGPTMVLLWLCLYFLLNNHWNSACCAFSYAVSIKMNVLLFAPGLLLLLIQRERGNLTVVIKRLLTCCALPQLVLGAPFLLTYPESYLRKAFELDRVFFFKWTVNWKFLPEEIFVSKPLAVSLLACHLGFLAYYCIQWIRLAQQQRPKNDNTRLSPVYICYTMFVANFLGIAFARTLHYQFYAWYISSIPFLLWSSARPVPLILRIVLLVALEYAFLTFPATPTSSLVLQLVHVVILWQIRPPDMVWENVEWVRAGNDGSSSSNNNNKKQQ